LPKTTRRPATARPASGWMAPGRLAFLALLCAIGVGFGVLIVREGMARELAGEHPEQALRWKPGHADALARAAEEQIAMRGDAGWPRADELARRSLAAGPIQARPIRLLGLAADARGDDVRAEALMRLAGERSWRDAPTHFWLFNRLLARRDYRSAMVHADAVMRRYTPGRPLVFAEITSALNDPAARDAVVRIMATDPPWRTAYIQALAGDDATAGAALDLLARLKGSAHPPSEMEVRLVMLPFFKQSRYPQAYLLWVEFLPAEALPHLGDIYDGDFQGLPGSAPFNWKAESTGGYAVEFGPGPGGDRAMHVTYDGQMRAVLAEQVLLLPPGRYELSLRSYLENTQSDPTLEWRIGCLPMPPELLKFEDAGEPFVWTTRGGRFEVPAGCRVQQLQLRGIASGQGAEAWYDKIALKRLGAEAAP
jgi:hypothetical protein